MPLPEVVIVWICENCGNYYASSSADDLHEIYNTNVKGEKTFPRSRCPTIECALKGINRVPMELPVRQLVIAGTEVHRSRRGEPPLTGAGTSDSPRWSGELCPVCSDEMVRTGNCLTCPSCGENTGCG